MAVRDVLTALSLDARARALAMATFKAGGGSLDAWRSSDRAAMVEALVAAEDDAEERSGPRKAREAMKAVRRLLEVEVYP
ncbi:MAG TPA: hypothetical protein VF316_25435 [Polyangiaceae bacterium]